MQIIAEAAYKPVVQGTEQCCTRQVRLTWQCWKTLTGHDAEEVEYINLDSIKSLLFTKLKSS